MPFPLAYRINTSLASAVPPVFHGLLDFWLQMACKFQIARVSSAFMGAPENMVVRPPCSNHKQGPAEAGPHFNC
jgi:hypothetical protein